MTELLRWEIEEGVYTTDQRLRSESISARRFSICCQMIRKAMTLPMYDRAVDSKQGIESLVSLRDKARSFHLKIDRNLHGVLSLLLEIKAIRGIHSISHIQIAKTFTLGTYRQEAF